MGSPAPQDTLAGEPAASHRPHPGTGQRRPAGSARTSPYGPARQVRDLLLTLIVGLALLTAGTVGWALAGRGSVELPTTASAEAGFARDMSVHHAQAVQMSLLVRDATTDPALRFMALDIATGQQSQTGMMSGWLTEWGLNQTDSSQPWMAW